MTAKTKSDIDRIIDAETAASEATIDDPAPSGGRRRGQAKSEVYSVRLTPDQVEQINALADRAGVPASTLVRDWVVQGLRAETGLIEDRFVEAVRLITSPEIKKVMTDLAEVLGQVSITGLDPEAFRQFSQMGLKMPTALDRRSRKP